MVRPVIEAADNGRGVSGDAEMETDPGNEGLPRPIATAEDNGGERWTRALILRCFGERPRRAKQPGPNRDQKRSR